jgi:hypothetical protein
VPVSLPIRMVSLKHAIAIQNNFWKQGTAH